jgi:hypothetical protein
MNEHSNEPPPVLDFARVLEYAILTSSVRSAAVVSSSSEAKSWDRFRPWRFARHPVERGSRCFTVTTTGMCSGAAPITRSRRRRPVPNELTPAYRRAGSTARSPRQTRRNTSSKRTDTSGAGFAASCQTEVERLVVHERGGPICDGCIDELHAFLHDESAQSEESEPD